MSGGDGVEVDWVFKYDVSVDVGGKDEGGLTLPILKVVRSLTVRREFRTAIIIILIGLNSYANLTLYFVFECLLYSLFLLSVLTHGVSIDRLPW